MAEYKDSEQQALEQLHEGPGQIQMSDEVIQTITVVEISKLEGLALADTRSKIYELVVRGKKDLSKIVDVDTDENHVNSINVAIVVDYGQSIYDISRELQRRVKNAVESMTGKIVRQVNVTVKGINMASAKAELEGTQVTAELIEDHTTDEP